VTYEVIGLGTNGVIAALDVKDVHHGAAVTFLDRHARDPLYLPAAVHAEVLAVPQARLAKRFLEEYRLRPIFAGLEARAAWELAADRFARYAKNRRKSKGGVPRRILADFLIGAQMRVSPGIGYTPALATFEGGFFERYFPELKVYDPAASVG